MRDVTAHFRGSGFKVFANLIESDPDIRVWAIPAPTGGSRAFCDQMNSWAQAEGQPGLAYIFFRSGEGAGPVARNLGAEVTEALRRELGLDDGDAVFFVCGLPRQFVPFAAAARLRLGRELGLTREGGFEFCWIVDFPMYELNEETRQIEFSHNPFSMPQGGLAALEQQDPLDIIAYQYDIVCNGVELSSGAIRNHRPDIMYKAFAIAGYSAAEVEARFAGMLNAFRYGAPPHGGSAPGHRPHRHAAGGYPQHSRGCRVSDEPAGAGPVDAGAGRGPARTPPRTPSAGRPAIRKGAALNLDLPAAPSRTILLPQSRQSSAASGAADCGAGELRAEDVV